MKAMEAKAHVRETKVKELLSHVRRHVQEEVEFGRVCYVTMMNMLTNGVVSVDFMDYEGNGIGRELKELITTVGELTRVTNLGDVFPVLKGLDVQGLGRKRKEVVGKIVKVWEGILGERRKLIGGHNDISTRDFLDVLIQNGMNDGQINQFIMVSHTFFWV